MVFGMYQRNAKTLGLELNGRHRSYRLEKECDI